MMRRNLFFVLLAFSCVVCGLNPVLALTGDGGNRSAPLALQLSNADQPLLPMDQEIELALKATPVHLRKDATVFVFGKNGYSKVRTGSNGFNCLVNRDGLQNGDESVHPTCWDVEGSRTILPVMLRVGELLAQSKSAAEIKRDIDEGFTAGKFQSPAKGGVAYMLAGDVKFDRKTGRLSTEEFPPHYMFYAPGVTNKDLGLTSEGMKQTPGLPFVYAGYSGGARTAYIIVRAQTTDAHKMNHRR